jgi:hypothetical protein
MVMPWIRLKLSWALWFGVLALAGAAPSLAQGAPGTTLNLVGVPLETMIEITRLSMRPALAPWTEA